MPSLATRSLLVKPVSGDCNARCSYCFYRERPSDPYRGRSHRRMSADVLEALVRQGMQLDRRVASFAWQGGEPTLAGLPFYRQVVALQQQYGRDGQAVSNALQTNGLLIDGEWAAFLAQYQFLVGVSLDGPARYHDA
ncbi:MAG: radical SAM protein, partial [Chloroflexi bacterium]|nr:radical SAM protein [Chloroflexota bacterium]